MPLPQPSNSGVPGFSSPSPQFAEPRLPNLSPTRLRPPGVSPTSAIVPYQKPPLPVRLPKGGRLPLGRFPQRMRIPKLPGRVLGRVAGPLAALLLAADIMEQLAPGFHQWLERQSGPGSGAKQVGPPPFSGGQTDSVCYIVKIALTKLDGSERRELSYGHWGPIGGVRVVKQDETRVKVQLYSRGVCGWPVAEPAWRDVTTGYPKSSWGTASIISIARQDGEPDTGGDPPGEPIPYFVVPTAPRQIPGPGAGPAPGRDSPVKRPPSVPTGSGGTTGSGSNEQGRPRTPIILIPGPNPYRPPWDPETGFPSDDPGTSENPRKRKLPTPLPAPIVPPSPPPPPRRPPDDSCQDPCWEFGFDFLERIWDALEQQKEPRGDECPELYDLYLPYTVCTDEGPEIKQAYLKAAFWEPPNIRELFTTSAANAAKACKEPEVVASVPEWWQVRLGAERPQLVLIFRRTGTRGYNQLAIPHPLVTEPPSEPPISAYTKGNWQGMITLRDNSKFIVYAATAGEAERVVNQARSLIRGDFLGSPPLISISEKKGYPLDNDLMVPTSAKYHPDGQRNLKPKWRASFTDRL